MFKFLKLFEIQCGDYILAAPTNLTDRQRSAINSGKVPFYSKFIVGSIQPGGLMTSAGGYFSARRYTFELLER